MAIELLKLAAEVNQAAVASGLPSSILRFSLEYETAPVLAEERARLAALLGNDGFSLRPLPSGEDPEILLLEFPAVQRQQSAAFLFEVAQELAEQLDLRSCTPDVEPGWIEDDELGRDVPESVSGAMRLLCESQAVPPSDPQWAIQLIRADRAWTRFSCKGEGILVGQPDTGVADHRELDDSLDMARGLDVIAGKGQPVDPLSGRFLTNPGHGTATASCVASRQAGAIAGSAPGAKVVPIRCVEHVILRGGSAVAAAIDHARKVGCHIVTMSLGGPVEFPDLRRAIQRAVDDGMIVLAAAGNCVRFVVYPAWDRNVIAIAGIDHAGLRWKGSSHGSKIDVAAPGEHVYVARRTTADDAVKSLVRPGQGTSFAVALTAGTAALWLSHHKVENVKAKAAARGLTVQDLFRAALRQSSSKLHNWPDSMGAGILNAEALLALDLDAIAPPATSESAHPALSLLGKDVDWSRFAAEAGFIALDREQRDDPARIGALESTSAPRPSRALRRAIKAADKASDEIFGVPAVVSPLTPEMTPRKAIRVIARGIANVTFVEAASVASETAARSFLEGSGGKSVLEHADRIFAARNSKGDADPVISQMRAELHQSIQRVIAEIGDGKPVSLLPPRSQVALEALIRMTGRPALRVIDDFIDKDDPQLLEWQGDLLMRRNQFKPYIRIVGRIDIEIDGQQQHVGTGTVVAPGVIMTNRHVLDAIAEPVPTANGETKFLLTGAVSIAFDATASDPKQRFRIRQVVGAGPERIGQHADIRKLDMAFLDVETANGTGTPLPGPLTHGDLPGAAARIIVIGYPAKPNAGAAIDPKTGKVSLDMWDRLWEIYQDQYGIKYVSPGEIVQELGTISDDAHKWAFSHDATTLAGNSGSSIVDLAGTNLCGLHFGGAPRRQNLAHGLKAVERAASGVIDPTVFGKMSWR